MSIFLKKQETSIDDFSLVDYSFEFSIDSSVGFTLPGSFKVMSNFPYSI